MDFVWWLFGMPPQMFISLCLAAVGLSLVGLIGISLVTDRGFTKAKKDGRIDIAVGGIGLRRLTERKRVGYERLV